MKLAFASNDGKFVSQHFGRALRFFIIEIDERDLTWRFVEKRENAAPCEMGEHDHAKLEKSILSLADCQAVFAAKAGNYAQTRLQRQGIQVLERPGFIEDLTTEYIRYLRRPLGARKRREVAEDHPCFSEKAHNKSGRLHLPVSPACNIQCRFCRRALNTGEERPGVSCGILPVEETVETVGRALAMCPQIAVVGIAGPGDTLATEHALETFQRVHAAFPGLIKCLSTNGLELPGKEQALWDAGVRTITVTVNAVDPAVLKKVVSWVKGDRDLIGAQLKGIRECAELGMVVKVNTVLIPGVNDHHVAEIARVVKRAGATRHNIIPLIPQHEFADVPAPTCAQIESARQAAGAYLEQFRHCKHCRADACGIPGVSDMAGALYKDRALETFSHG